MRHRHSCYGVRRCQRGVKLAHVGQMTSRKAPVFATINELPTIISTALSGRGRYNHLKEKRCFQSTNR